MDRPGHPAAELAECLADIATLNRAGPIRALLRHVAPFVRRHHGPEPFRVLDVGTGAADIPVALARWARARGHRVSILALDIQPEILACARARLAETPEIRLVAGEAVSPPVRPDGIDLALCSLMLHHLSEEGVGALLRSLARLARQGFVVSDLRRSRAAYAAAWLATRAISCNRLTRHDGPLSVRRAYTRSELDRLARASGLVTVRWHTAVPFRVIGVYVRRGARGAC
jgi:ubiquinone/menaquinone biosynthesis C-methylase UbiE